MIGFDHYKMADISIIHGSLVLVTGLLLIMIRGRISRLKKHVRAVHITLGILASVYGLITYLVTP